MNRLPREEDRDSPKYLEVQVQQDGGQLGRWALFLRFLKQVFSSREFRSAAKTATEVANEELIRARRVRNDHFEAQAKRELAEADKLLSEKARHEAEAHLLREQAQSVKTERMRTLMADFRKMGFNLQPVFNDQGEFVGLYLEDIPPSVVPPDG